MTQELQINGSTFFPTAVLGKQFGYTSDYLSKLARDGKVVGNRVGRQWFVERTSLELFLRKQKVDKAIRGHLIRDERKRELTANSAPQPVVEMNMPKKSLALASAFFLLLTGFGVGYLGWATATDKTHFYAYGLAGDFFTEVSVTTRDVFSYATEGFVAMTDQLASLGASPSSETFLPEEKIHTPQQPLESTVTQSTPKEPAMGMVLADGNSPVEVIADIRDQFSDPVQVEFENSDSGLITPIFRNPSDEHYRFLLVPIKETVE